MRWERLALALLPGALLALPARGVAQDNYEIQVYGSETVAAGNTMVELHSNYTAEGEKNSVDGLQPTDGAVHETLEITQGFTNWFETGFYVFTSIHHSDGWEWVGDHIRPRVRAPESWHWPVGVSLSTEIGYQQRKFSVDTWTLEIRPIVDKQLGRWYLSFNPTFERSLHGESESQGVEFSPNFKVSYDVVRLHGASYTKTVSLGLEYYGAFGPVGDFDPPSQQQQQFFPSIDVDVSPKWEINFGVGIGTTRSTDHLIVKCIIGRRFSWKHGKKAPGAAGKY